MQSDDEDPEFDYAWADVELDLPSGTGSSGAGPSTVPSPTGDGEPRILPRQTSKRVSAVPPRLPPRSMRETGPRPPRTEGRPPTEQEDPEVHLIASELRRLDPDGSRFAYALRAALDQAYAGRLTGRWDYSQLAKTEKTHIGTLVEIWFQREFEFADGIELDFAVCGVDVDCKWSRKLYHWEIPMEMYSRGDKIAMVVWANEYSARWALGLIRITEEVLRPMGRQRDRKRHLNDVGCDSVLWVYETSPFIENILLKYPEVALRMNAATSGQKAVDIVFRELQGELINHSTVEAAAQQVDSSRRARDCRKVLAPEGIVIFGHYDPHPQLASELGLPAPTLSRWVSARLAPGSSDGSGNSVFIDGGWWRLASDDDPVVAAPTLPQQGRKH